MVWALRAKAIKAKNIKVNDFFMMKAIDEYLKCKNMDKYGMTRMIVK